MYQIRFGIFEKKILLTGARGPQCAPWSSRSVSELLIRYAYIKSSLVKIKLDASRFLRGTIDFQ